MCEKDSRHYVETMNSKLHLKKKMWPQVNEVNAYFARFEQPDFSAE